MTNELGASPVARADAALTGQLPILPRHPRLFLLAYWLTAIAGPAMSPERMADGLPRLLASAILVTPLVLLIAWPWQIVQYTSQLEPIAGRKRPRRIAGALVLFPLGLLIVWMAWQRTPEQIAHPTPLAAVAANLGAVAVVGLFIIAARGIVGAERARGLPTLGGFRTVLLIFCSVFLAGYIGRRLRKLAAASAAHDTGSTAAHVTPAPG